LWSTSRQSFFSEPFSNKRNPAATHFQGSPITSQNSNFIFTHWLTFLRSGGLEMLFDDQRRHSVSLPAVDAGGKPANIAFLIQYLCKNLMKDPRVDLFVLDDHLYVLSPHPRFRPPAC
jgi:hypothetical protein